MVQPTLSCVDRHAPGGVDIPLADHCHVWIDFDGTISSKDVLDEIIRRCAVDDSWKAAELSWQRGEIGSRECLSRQFEVVRASEETVDGVLRMIGLDPGFLPLLALLRSQGVPTAVVSDGADVFIQRLLTIGGVDNLAVRCNRLVRTGDRLSLAFPHAAIDCESSAAHCKCLSMRQLSSPRRVRSIYIGDGRSDVCAARKCDVVFAKQTLANVFAAEQRPFVRYSTLLDVAAILTKAWASSPIAGG